METVAEPVFPSSFFPTVWVVLLPVWSRLETTHRVGEVCCCSSSAVVESTSKLHEHRAKGPKDSSKQLDGIFASGDTWCSMLLLLRWRLADRLTSWFRWLAAWIAGYPVSGCTVVDRLDETAAQRAASLLSLRGWSQAGWHNHTLPVCTLRSKRKRNKTVLKLVDLRKCWDVSCFLCLNAC